MQPFVVVKPEVIGQSCIEFWNSGVVFEVDVLVFD